MQPIDEQRRTLLSRSLAASGMGLAALLLPGCGGGDDAAAPPVSVAPPPPPPPAPAPSPPPAAATFLTTPASRFAGITDFPWAENYVTINGLRMHYVDTGPKNATHTFLCLHGEPSWSYLYREMIKVFEAAGHRVIAPDWFGFGKSDKPIADSTYTFTFHRESMLAFIAQLDLQNVTLVVQDWGGLLGLTIPPAMSTRFSRLVIMNTIFATGEPLDPSLSNFVTLSQARRERWLRVTDVDVEQIMRQGSKTASPAITANYNAPFPDPTYEAGARRFPIIVPITPTEEGAAISREAVAWWGSQWSGKSFMAVGVQDELLGPPVMNVMQKLIRNCPLPVEYPNAGHFVQEDAGTEIAEAALRAFG
jgi:haloalkane dehalogenase